MVPGKLFYFPVKIMEPVRLRMHIAPGSRERGFFRLL
jgi:hypothetical protein